MSSYVLRRKHRLETKVFELDISRQTDQKQFIAQPEQLQRVQGTFHTALAENTDLPARVEASRANESKHAETLSETKLTATRCECAVKEQRKLYSDLHDLRERTKAVICVAQATDGSPSQCQKKCEAADFENAQTSRELAALRLSIGKQALQQQQASEEWQVARREFMQTEADRRIKLAELNEKLSYGNRELQIIKRSTQRSRSTGRLERIIHC